MAPKKQKIAIEVLFAGAELGGIKLQPHLAKTTRLVTEEMLPEPGKAVTVEVPLHRPKFAKSVGSATFELRA